MNDVELIEIRPASSDSIIEIGEDQITDDIEIIGATPGVAQGGAKHLDDLVDVDGATAGFIGQVLTKDSDGQWRPMAPQGGGSGGDGGYSGPLSYLHTQVTPATVWIINHGLPFNPSGIEVRDQNGDEHHPVVSWPDGLTVRLDFVFDVRGTARLS